MEKKSNGCILGVDRFFLENKKLYAMDKRYSFVVVSNLQTKIIAGDRTSCGCEWAADGKIVFSDPFARLYWIEKGTGEVNFLSGEKLNLRPSYLFVIPPLSPARYKSHGKMILYWLHFRADIFSSVDFFSTLNICKEVKLRSKDGVNKDLWKQLLNLYRSDKISELLKSDIILRQMLAIFADTIPDIYNDGLDSLNRFEPVLHFINKNIARKISLSDLVEILPMNKSYFTACFTETIGLSPISFINNLKIGRAQFLLLHSNMGLKEIAAELGFDDYYYFSRVFKKYAGVSPKNYRLQMMTVKHSP